MERDKKKKIYYFSNNDFELMNAEKEELEKIN
jgi:hypothetical protein